jgi:hypothetical protein
VVEFDPDILAANPSLECARLDGQKFRMDSQGIRQFLKSAARTKDGRIRGVASKFLDGKSVGPFSYSGVRSDDPNDHVPHENRRELRGLRVIAAFLNNDDIRENNTLDMYVEEERRHFIRHHLIDFGNSLGSATNRPKNAKEGYEYHFEPGQLLKTLTTFGVDRPPRRTAGTVVFPSVGNFSSESFQPELWKSNLPNPAFEKLSDRDGFWGAKIVAGFSNDQIASAVHAGKYSDPDAERMMVEILRDRRDRTANYWFRRVAPLDGFRVAGNRLVFRDLAIEAGLDKPEKVVYDVWLNSSSQPSVFSALNAGTSMPVQLSAKSPLEVQITRRSLGVPDVTVKVFIQKVYGNPTVTSIQR